MGVKIRGTAVWSTDPVFVCGDDEKQSLQRASKHKRRIGHSHYE